MSHKSIYNHPFIPYFAQHNYNAEDRVNTLCPNLLSIILLLLWQYSDILSSLQDRMHVVKSKCMAYLRYTMLSYYW
jgi:hypothetical protein